MLVEGYIAAAALGLMPIAGIVVWADRRYQAARRRQRLTQRHG